MYTSTKLIQALHRRDLPAALDPYNDHGVEKFMMRPRPCVKLVERNFVDAKSPLQCPCKHQNREVWARCFQKSKVMLDNEVVLSDTALDQPFNQFFSQ